jgi:hypothetical protein
MYRNYEGHSIHATAWELLYPVGWEPLIFVTHREGAKEVTKSFTNWEEVCDETRG